MAHSGWAIPPPTLCLSPWTGLGGWTFRRSLYAGGRLSWPVRFGCCSMRTLSPGRVGYYTFDFSKQQRRLFPSWICFYYVAQGEIPGTEGEKIQSQDVQKRRKNTIRKVDNAKIKIPASNGFSHVEFEGKTAEKEQPVIKKRAEKKKGKMPGMAGGDVDSSTTHSRAKKKRVTSHSTIMSGVPSGLETDHGQDVGEERDDPSKYGQSSNELITNGEARPIPEDFSQEAVALGQENELRLIFLESIMERARSGDVEGVEEAVSEMEIAGIKAGPRAYHGLIVAYTRALDSEGALQAFRREVGAGERPLPETFVAMARLFGALGQAQRGKDLLGAMERLKHDARLAWLTLVEELQKSGNLQEANTIFLTGANGGMRGIPRLYDVLIEENAKVGDHAHAFDILRALEYAGFQPTTFHQNCLLMCQARKTFPEVVADTFEDMQYGPDEMKPDTESYNWLLEAHIRNKLGDRLLEVIYLLGEMVEDYKRVQPNMRTYSLLVECFTKYNVANEAVRHFRALSRIPGGTAFLYNEGKNSDPLSLYLRSLCLEGRALDLLEALEAMLRDNQAIPPRAMFLNQKGRTLISCWIEPIEAEADLGYEVDYVARYIAEGGAEGTRKRWSDAKSRKEDDEGFAFSAPVQVSFKQHCLEMRRKYHLKLMRKLRGEGVFALGPGATDADVVKVMAKLQKETIGEMTLQPKKPKAASKMLVSELKEELEAQGLPTDGIRPVLYQRVQKARRINRARGRPLWVPGTEDEVEEQEDDHSVDAFMGRLNLQNDNTEFWRKRLIGEDQESELFQVPDQIITETIEKVDLDDGEEDEDENDEVEEESEDLVDDGGEDEEPEAPELLALQLLKQKAELTREEKVLDDDVEGEWLGLTREQKIAKIRNEKLLDPSEMYTIADVWGWTWEKEIRAKEPERWSQELEVQLAMQIMQRVLDIGGSPTIGDCAMLVHAAMRTPWPEAIVSVIQKTHKLGIKFGSKLYNDAVKLCITLGEKNAAIAIITDMEAVGIPAPGDLISTVLMGSSGIDSEVSS